VITPRATRLVRVPDLKAMRDIVAHLVGMRGPAVRRAAVLVPTRGAAEELRVSLENRLSDDVPALLLPDLLTRTDLYRRLHGALRGAPRLLADAEREVLLRKAARDAIAAGTEPPFKVRPGLIVQMLDFYDELRRREQTLSDFERLATAPLAASAEMDRGAERLLRQTEFLVAAFTTFEKLVAGTDAIDEHGLRAILLNSDTARPAYDHLVVTVADQAADARGLYGCDFDLLARLSGLARIDIVATEALLATGYLERVHGLLPGIEEESPGGQATVPVLVAPECEEAERRWFTYRDREDELAHLVRWLRHRGSSPHANVRPPALDRFGVVFQRPLPYLYLARQVFADGRLPYQAVDSLPLSAEPFAATLDIVLSVLTSEANRASIMELLRSPHLSVGQDLTARDLAELEKSLAESRYTGGWERLSEGVAQFPLLQPAVAAAEALRPVVTADSASVQIDSLIGFLRRFERTPRPGASWIATYRRARAAVLAALETLRDAHARHDDTRMDIVELSGSVRRWIDAQTFSPRTGRSGVRLLDAASAPYSDVDELRIVGLVEGDWPEPARRSIFYPASILSSMRWPADTPRNAAARAQFQDLLTAAVQRISVSTFTLEEDAIVPASPLLEEIESAGLPIERWPAPPPGLVFTHEWMAAGTAPPDDPAAAWLGLRKRRTPSDDEAFAGFTGPRSPRTYAISYLERYLDCPFKYFASQVLRLPEERDEESGLTPIERGHFIHDVFESFFKEWQAAGGGTITTANVAGALELFEAVALRKLERLPQSDRPLERNHLLGSAAASGLAERAFAFEIEQGGEVVERLLEHVLEGEYAFAAAGATRRIRIKAKADRIDLMADGTLRIIDYKLGRAPKQSRALQLPIYGVIAEQELNGHRGRSWRVGAAGYVAFKEKDAFVPLGRSTSLEAAIADGQQRLLAAVDAIERGSFPVQPDEPFRCQWCGYAGVCRKDYVGDE
jgi:RecB family exonuclease